MTQITIRNSTHSSEGQKTSNSGNLYKKASNECKMPLIQRLTPVELEARKR